jgi:protein phosphatase
MALEAYAATDPSPHRDNNEDSFHVDVEHAVFIVADGMGGNAAGEVASRLAVEALGAVLTGADDPDETRLVRDADLQDATESLRERLRYGMNQASVRIRREIEVYPSYSGMGTTVVALVMSEQQAHIAHVGDSRAYLYRGGRLTRLTRDHSVVQQEIDAGRLTPELARMVRHKHVLTQSVGAQGTVEPDTLTRSVTAGDVFILCSDGLTDPMDDEQIQEVVRATPADLLADTLVREALDRGGEDNVTIVVVAVT